MRNLKMNLILVLVLFAFQKLNGQDIEARIIYTGVDPQTKVFEVEYEITNSDPNDLYLVEVSYYEMYSKNTIIPQKRSLSGDVGEYAIRGGVEKIFFWDSRMEPKSKIEVGLFLLDVTLIRAEYSRQVNRLYGRQNKVKVKLDDPNIRSRKRRRLTRRLENIGRRIDKAKRRGRR